MTLPLRRGAIAALLAVTFVPFTAEADPERNRFYASVSGLYLVPKDSRSFGEDAVFSADGSVIGDTKYTIDVDMDSGFGLLAAFGYGPEIGLRAEIEIGFRKSDWVVDSTGHGSLTLTQTQAEDASSIMPLGDQQLTDAPSIMSFGDQLPPDELEAVLALRQQILNFATTHGSLPHGSLQSVPDNPDNRPSVTQVDILTAAQYSGNTESLSLMANAIYTFDAGRVRPYVGGGLGFARHDVTIEAGFLEVAQSYDDQDEQDASRSVRAIDAIERTSQAETVLAMQALFGVSFPVSERLEARLGYRYFRTRATGDSDGNGLSYSTRNVEAGLLFRF